MVTVKTMDKETVKQYDTETQTVKVIEYEFFDEQDEQDGVCNALNGFTDMDSLLGFTLLKLGRNLNGARVIAELEPNTELLRDSIQYLSEDLYQSNDTFTVDNETIDKAKVGVKNYELLISFIENLKTLYAIGYSDK